jgi:hypothetical protein
MRRAVAVLVLAAALAAGCASGSSRPQLPTIGAAKTFRIAGFEPAGNVQPGRPTKLSFRIDQPSGAPLTRYKTGPGPHTGVHLIIVRDDLSVIIHRHPPIAADGRITETFDFPEPGRYLLLVDVYPRLSGPNVQPNFQLHRNLDVAGAYKPQRLPGYRPSETVDGYRVVIHGRPRLRALQPAFMNVTVTDPNGKPARFTPWYGALAHAIFFRQGSLDYFHTHVCGPTTPGCTSVLGTTRVTGRSSTPGRLRVGILIPVPGIWRLFLQTKVNGTVITAPFTLRVA